MEPTVIVRFDADVELSFHAIGDVRFLVVDERVPNDRVYEITDRKTPEAIAAIIGDSEIHSKHDARHPAIEARIIAFVEGKPHLRPVTDD